MKKYTVEERAEARKGLPRPLAGFVGSDILTALYLNIKDKLKLNFAQVIDMSEVVNMTLLGLEKESVLETNLRQWVSGLSDADMQELVTELNDRVFKEAQRRLRDNIIEPGFEEKKPEEEGSGESVASPEVSVLPVAPKISTEKLAAPTMTKADPKDIPRPPSGIQQVSVPPPQAPRIYKGGDPYREPVE